MGLRRSGRTITGRPSRSPYEIVQPTAHELHAEFVQSSERAIHLFGFSISVAVGQTSMQAPQKSQFDSWIAPPVPKAISVVGPLPARLIAPVWRRSAQARTQRVQMMHICGSNSRNGLARSTSGGGVS